MDDATNSGDEGRGIMFGTSIDATIATPWIGYTGEVGSLGTRENARDFGSHGKAYGIEASIGFNLIIIVPNKGSNFSVDDFAGNSTNFTGGYGFFSAGYEGDGHYDWNFGNNYKVYMIGIGFGFGGSTSRQQTNVWVPDPRIDKTYPTIKF